MTTTTRRVLIIASLASLVAGLLTTMPRAQEVDEYQPVLPDIAMYKAMLDANRQTGWVQFRNFGDGQLIYFTALQTMRCRLSEVRFSINSDALDRRFPLGPCDPQQPFNIPDDPDNKFIYQRYAPDSVRTLTIQVVWSDGSGSEIITYRPCDHVGESTCARLQKVNKPKLEHGAPTPASQSR
jgi:hypothetical protein